jgi:hypothetical protein
MLKDLKGKRKLTYVLSFAALLGFRPLGGIMSCPAAINSSSPKILSNDQLWSVAILGSTIFAVQAIPGNTLWFQSSSKMHQ